MRSSLALFALFLGAAVAFDSIASSDVSAKLIFRNADNRVANFALRVSNLFNGRITGVQYIIVPASSNPSDLFAPWPFQGNLQAFSAGSYGDAFFAVPVDKLNDDVQVTIIYRKNRISYPYSVTLSLSQAAARVAEEDTVEDSAAVARASPDPSILPTQTTMTTDDAAATWFGFAVTDTVSPSATMYSVSYGAYLVSGPSTMGFLWASTSTANGSITIYPAPGTQQKPNKFSTSVQLAPGYTGTYVVTAFCNYQTSATGPVIKYKQTWNIVVNSARYAAIEGSADAEVAQKNAVPNVAIAIAGAGVAVAAVAVVAAVVIVRRRASAFATTA